MTEKKEKRKTLLDILIFDGFDVADEHKRGFLLFLATFLSFWFGFAYMLYCFSFAV